MVRLLDEYRRHLNRFAKVGGVEFYPGIPTKKVFKLRVLVGLKAYKKIGGSSQMAEVVFVQFILLYNIW